VSVAVCVRVLNRVDRSYGLYCSVKLHYGRRRGCRIVSVRISERRGRFASAMFQQLTSLPGNHTAFCTRCCVHNVRDFLRNKFTSTFFQSTNL
jgi:hypothetical protein